MDTVLTINIVAIALLAWVSLFRIVPACAMSRFRYRLWQLRDQLFDEIRQDCFEDNEQPRRLLAVVEAAIAGAAEVSILNFTLIHVARRGLPDPEVFQIEDLSAHDRTKFEERFSTFHDIVINHAICGTPSGWAALALGVPAALVMGLLRRDSHDEHRGGGSLLRDAGRHVRDEFDVDPVFAAMSTRNGQRRRSLYSSV